MQEATLAEIDSLQRFVDTYIRDDAAQKVFVHLMGRPSPEAFDAFMTSNGYNISALLDETVLREAAFSQGYVLNLLLNYSEMLAYIAGSAPALNTIVNDPVLMDMVAANEVFRNVVGTTGGSFELIAASSMALAKYAAGTIGLDPSLFSSVNALIADPVAADLIVSGHADLVTAFIGYRSTIEDDVLYNSVVTKELVNISPDLFIPEWDAVAVTVPTLSSSDSRAVADSNFSSSWAPHYAFNGSASSASSTSSMGVGGWVRWDFGEPVWCYRAIYQTVSTRSADRVPTRLAFEGADDPSGPWETAVEFVDGDGHLSQTLGLQEFIVAEPIGKKRYWRIRAVENSSYFHVAVLQFWCL